MHLVRPRLTLVGLAAGLTLAISIVATAAPPLPVRGVAPAAPASPEPVPAADLPWSSLKPAERKGLAPLERDWSHLSAQQRRLWVELAQRMPTMSTDRQQRIQARMAEWARMSPAERGQARLRFIQSQRTGTENREQRWDDYKALPSEQKKEFAARAAAPAGAAAQKIRPGSAAADAGNSSSSVSKSNLVSNPNFGAQPKTIAPTMLKAGPGASTTTVTKTATPPSHQQIGLPKIAASPRFVDRDTLLPKRGPQGAAAMPVNEVSVEEAEPVPRP